MDDNQFVRALKEVVQKFEQQDHSQQTIDQFFQIADSRQSLPPNSDAATVEAFLVAVIFLISHKNGQTETPAIRVMLNYLRHDPNLFARLKPNRVILRKMDLDRHFKSDQADREASLELASFLLRYHQDIDYMDFTDDSIAI